MMETLSQGSFTVNGLTRAPPPPAGATHETGERNEKTAHRDARGAARSLRLGSRAERQLIHDRQERQRERPEEARAGLPRHEGTDQAGADDSEATRSLHGGRHRQARHADARGAEEISGG